MDKKTDQAQDLLEGQEILPGFTAQEVPPAQAAHDVNEGQAAPAQKGKAGQSLRRIREELAQGATPEEYREKIGLSAQRLLDYLDSSVFQEIRKLAEGMQAIIDQLEMRMEALPEPKKKLAPFLLDEAAEDPEIADRYSLEDLLEMAVDDEGNPVDGPLREMVERAKRSQAKFFETKALIAEADQLAEELPRIISNPAELLAFPLDKPNSVIWNLLAEADPSGQIAVEIETTGQKDRKKGKEALIYYAINFEDIGPGLTISKQLTNYDKRVYTAAAALFNAGNDTFTSAQLHRMMGNSGQPSAKQIQRMNDSLTKMGAARIYIDNTGEITVNKGYKHFRYDASLLPFERVRAYINNTLTDSAIHLFREPPMITFAKERDQITTVPRKLLESPISKTDANLTLEDYLIERIAHMKNPTNKAPRKILFSTVFEHCHINGKTDKDRKERERTPEKIRKYLDHYKSCGWIVGYILEANSVTICLERQPKSLPVKGK